MTYFKFDKTEAYDEWFDSLPLKTQAIIAKRIKNIEDYGHFGDFKNVSEYDRGLTKNRIFELRWDDGKRVYYAKVGNSYLLLLYGGNKNGQNKAINEAKKIFLENIEEDA